MEHLAGAEPTPYDQTNPTALIGTLTEVVRAMDQGVISTPHVQEVFAAFRIPEFSFGRWMAEMVEEGVYLELDRAA